MNNLIIGVYAIYLVYITIATLYVSHKLFSHSRVFMNTIFNGREMLANATNSLFQMGFFLLSFGAALYMLEEYRAVETYKDFFDMVSTKTGGYTIILGVLMMFNMFMFFRGMKHRNRSAQPEIASQLV